jgi:hypothetical protein
MADKHDEPDNPDVRGRDWYGPLSLQPLVQLKKFVDECDDFTKELRAESGSSVFKAHPGIKSTFITDMAGLEFVFNAPVTQLDRLDDEHPGFGGLAFNREMLGGVVPTLMRHAGDHDPSRAFILAVLKLRRGAFRPAAEKVLHYGIPMLREAPRGTPVNFQHALHHAAIGICFEWLFDIIMDSPTAGADAESWIRGCFSLRSDQPVANALARVAARLKNGPNAGQRDYSARTMDAIRASAPYPSFVEAARRVGVPEGDVAGHLMFAASFNAVGGAWSTLHPALAQLSVDAVTRARLAKELVAFRGSVYELNDLPHLHDFFLESMRLFGRPRHYYRRAKVDLDVPVSAGQPVHVKAGTTLCLVATSARQDRVVWGDDAAIFDPERYGRKPALRDRVHPFGPPPSSPSQYGCAGMEDHAAAILWKTLAAALGRSLDWKLSPWPEPDVDAFAGVRPAEFKWVRE